MRDKDVVVELEAIKLVANSKDPKMVTQLDENWFTYYPCKQAIRIWKADPRNFEFINFSAYANEKNFSLTKTEKEEIYEFPVASDDLNSCIKIIRRKYRQRLIDSKLEDVRKRIYTMSPEEAEVELMTYFKNEEIVERRDRRRVTDNFEQLNEDLVILGGSIRPALDNIMPIKKTIITLGADSGHHKSNSALEILILFIKNNPNKVASFFSFEMDFKEVQARIYSKCLQIDLKSIMRRKNADGSKLEVERLTDRMLNEHPEIVENLIIYDAQDFKKTSDISRLLIQDEPDIWSLDFLQYFAQMTADNNASEQNKNVMETIAFTKNIAQVTNSLGIVLSQIKKMQETRLRHFPRINDLEWSGLTKQISHSIAMCWWGYKHNAETAPKDFYIMSWQKVRNGDLQSEEMRVIPEMCSFGYPYRTRPLTPQEKQILDNVYKL